MQGMYSVSNYWIVIIQEMDSPISHMSQNIAFFPQHNTINPVKYNKDFHSIIAQVRRLVVNYSVDTQILYIVFETRWIYLNKKKRRPT